LALANSIFCFFTKI